MNFLKLLRARRAKWLIQDDFSRNIGVATKTLGFSAGVLTFVVTSVGSMCSSCDELSRKPKIEKSSKGDHKDMTRRIMEFELSRDQIKSAHIFPLHKRLI